MSGTHSPGSHGTPERVRALLDDLRRSVSGEIEELARFGEQLERSTASLVDELRGVLGQLDGAPPAAPVDTMTFDTAVTIDAGPFPGLAPLDAFLQAVRRVPGARDVSIRGFQGDRATFDVRLAWPVALVAALRAHAPAPFSVSAAGQGHLTLTLADAPVHADRCGRSLAQRAP